jgi:hypothetical protein
MRLAERVKEAEQQAAEREERAEQLDKMVKTNENVINWLNKQLNTYKAAETGNRQRGRERKVHENLNKFGIS